MSRTYTGGPAFPAPSINAAIPASNGMTLRDYFAAKAMAAYWTDPEVSECESTQEYVAQWAYEMADAMLEERVK